MNIPAKNPGEDNGAAPEDSDGSLDSQDFPESLDGPKDEEAGSRNVASSVAAVYGTVRDALQEREDSRPGRASTRFISAKEAITRAERLERLDAEIRKQAEKFMEGVNIEDDIDGLQREAEIYRSWMKGKVSDLEARKTLLGMREKRKKSSTVSLTVDDIGRIAHLLPINAEYEEMGLYKPVSGYNDITERSHPGYLEALRLVDYWIGRAMDSGADTSLEALERTEDRIRFVDEEKGDEPGKKLVVEIGAGTGLATLHLSKQLRGLADLAAVELDKNAFKLLRKNVEEAQSKGKAKNVIPLRGDGEYVKFLDKGISFGVLIFALHHFGPIKAIKTFINLREGMEESLRKDPTWEPEVYMIEECPSYLSPKTPEEAKDMLAEIHGLFIGHITRQKVESELAGKEEDVIAAAATANDETESLREGTIWIQITSYLLEKLGLPNYWPDKIEDWVTIEKKLEEFKMPPLPESGELKLSMSTIKSLLSMTGFSVVEEENTTETVLKARPAGRVVALKLRLKGWQKRQKAVSENLHYSSEPIS